MIAPKLNQKYPPPAYSHRSNTPRRSSTGASSIAAMILSSPPQLGKCSRSKSKTRSSRAQLLRAGRPCGLVGSATPNGIVDVLRFTGLFDMLGSPTITLPGGFSACGMPIGY